MSTTTRTRWSAATLWRPATWRPSAKGVTITLVILIIGYLVIGPVLYLLWGTFGDPNGGLSLAGFQRAFGDPQSVTMVWNSIVFAAGAALLALVLGTVLAYLQARTDVPFRGIFFIVALVPLVVPAVIYAPAWVFLLSNKIGLFTGFLDWIFGSTSVDAYGLPGMILVEGLRLSSIVFLFMVPAFRGMDPSLEQSARVAGARWLTVMWRITLPLSRPALAASALIITVLGLESFEVPIMMGEPGGVYVFTSRIYFLTNRYPVDLGAAGALGVSLMVVALVLLLLSQRGTGRGQQTISGKAFRPDPIALGRARSWAGAGILVYFFFSAIAPLGMLIYVSLIPFFQRPTWNVFSQFRLDNYVKLMQTPGLAQAVINTVVMAVVAATVVMLLTTVAAWFVVRSRVPGRRLVDVLAVTPLVIPGIVLGLGLMFIYLRSPIPIYGTLVILILACATQTIPYGMRYAGSAMSQIGDELEEAAQVGGASWWVTMRRVVLPLAAPGILSGWIFVMMNAFRELSSVVLLSGPNSDVLSVVMLREYSEGTFGMVAAIGVLMVIVLLAVVLAAYRFGARFGV